MKYNLYAILFFSLIYSGASRAAFSHDPLAGEAYTLTDQAYQALARHDEAAAETLVVQARKMQPDSYQLAMLLLDIEMRREHWQQAQQLSDELLPELPGDALLLANSGFIAARQNRLNAARRYFAAALLAPGLDASQQKNVRNALDHLSSPAAAQAVPPVVAAEAPLDAAYRHLREHDDVQALAMFQKGFAAQAGTPNQYADAAYAAHRLHQKQLSIQLFQQALDANQALPAGQQPFDAQQVFNYRNEIQQMNRSWGAVTSLAYQNTTLSSTTPLNTVPLNTLQGSVEAYWQPDDFVGNQDGHLFQLFTGDTETLYDAHGGQTGNATGQGTLGMRYKPFSDLGLMLTAQRLVALGNASFSDNLLRVAYSNASGAELNVRQTDWRAWQFYTEAAYFLNARRSIDTFEGSYGQAFHALDTNGRVIVYPHVVLASEYDSAILKSAAVGVGPGVKVRFWLREDAYNAPASWLDLTLQYRWEPTNTNLLGGWVVRTIFWY